MLPEKKLRQYLSEQYFEMTQQQVGQWDGRVKNVRESGRPDPPGTLQYC